jgi:hypothetical protein
MGQRCLACSGSLLRLEPHACCGASCAMPTLGRVVPTSAGSGRDDARMRVNILASHSDVLARTAEAGHGRRASGRSGGRTRGAPSRLGDATGRASSQPASAALRAGQRQATRGARRSCAAAGPAASAPPAPRRSSSSEPPRRLCWSRRPRRTTRHRCPFCHANSAGTTFRCFPLQQHDGAGRAAGASAGAVAAERLREAVKDQ